MFCLHCTVKRGVSSPGHKKPGQDVWKPCVAQATGLPSLPPWRNPEEWRTNTFGVSLAARVARTVLCTLNCLMESKLCFLSGYALLAFSIPEDTSKVPIGGAVVGGRQVVSTHQWACTPGLHCRSLDDGEAVYRQALRRQRRGKTAF